MIKVHPLAYQKTQPELLSGETILWAGIPNPSVIFHSDDWTLIPFSLLWTGFFVFWEASVLGMFQTKPNSHGPSMFTVVWGIPFLLVGNYMVWGRFLMDAWRKRRTYYALTSQRAFVLQEAWTWRIRVSYLKDIALVEREGNEIGTIWLGPKYPLARPKGSKQKTRSTSRFSFDDVPVFADIDDVDSVHRLILDLQAKLRGQQSHGRTLTHNYP